MIIKKARKDESKKTRLLAALERGRQKRRDNKAAGIVEEPKKRIPSPLRAIRAKCKDCCGGSGKEVEVCTVKNCPLWKYRFGKRSKTMHKRGKAHLIGE